MSERRQEIITGMLYQFAMESFITTIISIKLWRGNSKSVRYISSLSFSATVITSIFRWLFEKWNSLLTNAFDDNIEGNSCLPGKQRRLDTIEEGGCWGELKNLGFFCSKSMNPSCSLKIVSEEFYIFRQSMVFCNMKSEQKYSLW